MDKQQTQSWKEKLEQVRGYNKSKVEVELTEEQLQENEIEALLKEEFVEENEKHLKYLAQAWHLSQELDKAETVY